MSDDEKVYHWFIFAGTQPAILVARETNTLDAIKQRCRNYAKIHKAAIWAAVVNYPTGILAWPTDDTRPANPRPWKVEIE